MSKHTKGPWQYGYSEPMGVWVVTTDHSPTRADCEGVMVSDVNAHHRHRLSAPESVEANARLIAAAPDLLDALRQIVADWDSVPESARVPDEINDTSHWDVARAAIAKATG